MDLFVGARTERDLYDLPALQRLEQEHPWLTVSPVVTQDDAYGGERGSLPEVVVRRGPWSSRDVYVSGSRAVVRETVQALVQSRLPQQRIRVEEFTPSSWSVPGAEGERSA